MTILITGATGFIGRHVCAELSKSQALIAVLRQPEQQLPLLRQQATARTSKRSLATWSGRTWELKTRYPRCTPSSISPPASPGS
jgi:nucleoside-diphosphate-sugar epimerase